MWRLVIRITLLSTLVASAAAQAPLFGTRTDYAVGGYPRSVFASDLDGDGDYDLATANSGPGNVSVLLNNGDGTFQVAVDYAVGDSPQAVVSFDLDGDGDNDLATANRYSDDVSILLNNGDGTFQDSEHYAVQEVQPRSLCAEDLDGDGDIDLAVVTSYLWEGQRRSYYVILENTGDGTFEVKARINARGDLSCVIASDFDGDGDHDLAVIAMHPGRLTILRNNGDAIFELETVSGNIGSEPVSLFASDLDGDGDNDLVVANSWYWNTAASWVSTLMNNGDGTFQPAVRYETGHKECSVFALDLDGDSDNDVAVASSFSHHVSVLINDGNGTLNNAGNHATGSGPVSVFAADLDGDGDNDLVTANYSSNGTVSVLLNLSNDPPIVTITRPIAGEIWTIGDAQTIGWTLSGGLADHIALYLSRDAGVSWESSPIASFDYMSVDHFDWTVTEPEPVTYCKIKVVASNAHGTGVDESELFTIAASQTSAISYGTTVIVHGYVLDVGEDEGLTVDVNWTVTMAKAVVDRLGLGEVYTIVDGAVSELPYEVGVDPEEGEKVVVFDWIAESNLPIGGYLEAAADALAAVLIQQHLDEGGVWSLGQLHFIGHSRGALVCSETIERLGLYSSEIAGIDSDIHLTTLDAHPWEDESHDCVGENGLTGGSADDYEINSDNLKAVTGEPGEGDMPQAVVCWQNVGYADNYRQGQCDDDHFLPNGLHSYLGLSNNPFTNVSLYDGSDGADDIWSDWPEGYNHRAVHAWYYGTIEHGAVDDGDNMVIDQGVYYPNREDLVLGFNIGKNLLSSFVSVFEVVDRIPVSEDISLRSWQIFNWDFSYIVPMVNYAPGWSLHGGGGTGKILYGQMELDKFNDSCAHNILYVPLNVTHLEFTYRVTNKDDVDSDATDSLDVVCVNNDLTKKIGSIDLSQYQFSNKKKRLDITAFSGTTISLHFVIGDYNEDGVDSRVIVDDVHFHINHVCPLLQVCVESPVDIEIISPTGELHSRDVDGIAYASYDRYELYPGDTGATITIPNPVDGTYLINVVPHPNTTPEDEYSLYVTSGQDVIIFADNERIGDIPPDGYSHTFIGPCCVGRVGDANNSGEDEPSIGDVAQLVDHLFIDKPELVCVAEADINQSGGINPSQELPGSDITIGDIAELVDYLFITGPALGELPDCL